MPTPAVTKLFAVLCTCAILGGCATSSHDGRAQMLVPAPLSAVYSDVNMQLKLVAIADDLNRCTGPGWGAPGSIEERAGRLGPELAAAAFKLYPELGNRVERFDFIIADKSEPGTVASASVTATSFVGSRVVVTAYRPKQRDEADAIAMNLLARLGYNAPAVAAAFAAADRKSAATEWTSHLWASVDRLSAPPATNPADLPQATASAQ